MAGIEMNVPLAGGQKLEARADAGSARAVAAKPSGGEAAPAGYARAYLRKFRGAGVAGAPRPHPTQHLWSFLGAFLGFALLGLMDRAAKVWIDGSWAALTPPFGAMAVLVFSACKAPLAQPRNVIVGNFIGGTVGYLVWTFMHELCVLLGKADADLLWLTAAFAVSLTIVVQERLGAVLPPGGATALIYVIVPPVRAMGAFYPIFPCLVCPCAWVGLGVLTNNLSRNRAYPQTSWRSAGRPGSDAKSPAPATWLAKYVKKLGGMGVAPPPKTPVVQSCWSFLGSFVGIATLALLPRPIQAVIPGFPAPLLVGSFGAMAVLVFGAYKAPLAQPKNAVLGNGIGAACGVAVYHLFALFGNEVAPELLWLRAGLAVPLTIVLQEATGTVHPPGGATAMVFLIMKPLHSLSFLYVITPAMFGAVVMVCLGMVMNNLTTTRAYPQGWW